MKPHFLFESGNWIGNGKVSFSMSSDVLSFDTKWVIIDQDGIFQCIQTVQMNEGDQIVNMFTIDQNDEHSFAITLENKLLGIFEGAGVVENEAVAWEFRFPGTFEGYEIYERINDNEYHMRAEYLSSTQARTIIKGSIWKKEDSHENTWHS